MEKIVDALWATWDEGKAYGKFHWICLAIMAVLILFFIIAFKNGKVSDKTFKSIMIFNAFILILFDIYGEIVFSYSPSTGEWHYAWSRFPFQFSSMPMYFMLFAGLAKPGKFASGVVILLEHMDLLQGCL